MQSSKQKKNKVQESQHLKMWKRAGEYDQRKNEQNKENNQMKEVFVLLLMWNLTRIVQQLQDKPRQQWLEKKEGRGLSIHKDAGGVGDIKLGDAAERVQGVCGGSNKRRGGWMSEWVRCRVSDQVNEEKDQVGRFWEQQNVSNIL